MIYRGYTRLYTEGSSFEGIFVDFLHNQQQHRSNSNSSSVCKQQQHSRALLVDGADAAAVVAVNALAVIAAD